MRKGFTLIELMIVIAIIAIIAAIAIPNLLESRVTANEAAAASTLKSGIFANQALFQGGGNQDADQDARGEYGTIEALAGLKRTTMSDANSIRLITGPLAAAASLGGAVGATGMRTSSGFNYMVIMPGTDDAAVSTTVTIVQEGMALTTAAVAQGIDSGAGWACNSAEQFYAAAASPERYGDTGRRSFVLTQDGNVRSPAKVNRVNAWWPGATAPANGTASSAATILAGVTDFLTIGPDGAAVAAAFTAPSNWSVAAGIRRVAPDPENYPTISK